MTKELNKATMTESKLKNMYTEWLLHKNLLTFKKSQIICNNLSKKAKKSYFEKYSLNRAMGSKTFWDRVKPFLPIKGFHA